MKTSRRIFLAVYLVFWASTSFAALQLREPAGLAVDAEGNLYVANFGLNNILVYSPKYLPMFNKAIKQDIFEPQAVAIDPYGNVWVANFRENVKGKSNGYITEYTGVTQIAASTIQGVVGPTQLVFDSLDNLWVMNDGDFITVYGPTTAFAPPSHLFKQIDNLLRAGFTEFTLSSGVMVSGDSTQTFVDSASVLLQGPSNDTSGAGFGVGAAAMAPDNSGNTYVSDLSGNVNILKPDFTLTGPIFTLGFTPRGMAVDNKNKRLYASNSTTNEIVVYSIVTGELLETIGNTE